MAGTLWQVNASATTSRYTAPFQRPSCYAATPTIHARKVMGETTMLGMLLLLLLLIVLFGGLGIFVAKVFFIALAVAVVLSLLTGSTFIRRR